MHPAKRFAIYFFALFLTSMLSSSCSYFKSEPQEAEQTVESESLAETEESMIPDDKDAQIENLEEKIVLLEDKVSILESQVAGQKKVVYTVEYSDPAQLYQKARGLLIEKKYTDAADLFTTFAKKHPDHALADNSLYWLGECHYTTGQYDKSIAVFKELLKTYPKAQKVPDALLKTGYAYISLDDVNRASHYLKLVVKKHPFSLAAEKAEKKLLEFQ